MLLSMAHHTNESTNDSLGFDHVRIVLMMRVSVDILGGSLVITR